jgi:cell division protein ZapA
MAEVSISINGRVYDIACDNGQEGRLVDLASYVDQRLQAIARSGAAYSGDHLMILTTLVLADEIFSAKKQIESMESGDTAPALRAPRKGGAAAPAALEDEKALAKVIEQIAKRIDGIAAKVQAA